MYFIYLLKSEVAHKSYVGVTNNLERRLGEHNSGRHAYTKRYLPWRVVYTENYDNFKEARQREKYLKSSSGRKLLKKIFASIE